GPARSCFAVIAIVGRDFRCISALSRFVSFSAVRDKLFLVSLGKYQSRARIIPDENRGTSFLPKWAGQEPEESPGCGRSRVRSPVGDAAQASSRLMASLTAWRIFCLHPR